MGTVSFRPWFFGLAMIILSLDPGYTTGWCKIEVEDEKPKYLFSGNTDKANLTHAISSLLRPETINRIVVERLPYQLPPIMSAIDVEIRALIKEREYKLVAPAEWKPITGRYPLPKLDWRTTKHERDAWRMGVFWLWKEGLIKI
jgi:hypothetical protein